MTANRFPWVNQPRAKRQDHNRKRPSYGLIRTWHSTLNIQFQFERDMSALDGRRAIGNVSPVRFLRLIAFLLFASCHALALADDDKAGDFVLVISDDIKQMTKESQRIHQALRATAKTEKDELALKRDAQRLYQPRLEEVIDQYWQKATLKKNQDWRKVWTQRVEDALSAAKAKKLDADSLAKVFPRIREFDGGGDAQIPVRVLLAKFGDEDVWIVLVHWERAESVATAVSQNDGIDLGHVLAMAFRTTDQELITLTYCN